MTTRRLHLLRHAKAEDFVPGASDHDRPLTERGRSQAARVAETVTGTEHVLCSTARRTRETLAGLGLDLPADQVEFTDALYNAAAESIAAEIAGVDDEVTELLVVGHSPGIPGLASDLAGPDSDPAAVAAIADRFPTATLATVEWDGPWASPAATRLVFTRPG